MGDDWPDIRGPLRAGWEGGAPNGVRATAMEMGPSKKRVDSVAGGALEPFTFKLSDAHAALVDAHYLANKALRFNFPHPIWGAVEACYDPNTAPSWSEDGPWRVAKVRLEIYR